MFPIIKGTGYILIHAPSMIYHNGTTATSERESNKDSEYLKKIPSHLRSFKEAVGYAPNQAYIGNITPDQIRGYEKPWYKNLVSNATRVGKHGDIMPEDEFVAFMRIADAFDLVMLDSNFIKSVADKLSNSNILFPTDIKKLGNGYPIEEIKVKIDDHAEGLYVDGNLVGCVKRAHDKDTNLTAHIIFENLVAKASGIVALRNMLAKVEIDPLDIDYVIECSEEACGDMNQRGGGNFAKAIAEDSGLLSATGSDLRAFCAAPAHALIEAAALVKAGVYKNVVVVAGGASAKLGMNGKDHVKNGLPILEDCIGGFAVLISENDGHSPIIRTDIVGRHTVGTGSSPQAVITALISTPLEKADLKITDVDKYSVEMQTSEITETAGAGDVPTSNYKMIAALAVKKGDLQKTQMQDFILKHGMPGFAPTQGHIPSGVPFLGHAKDLIEAGQMQRAMIVGKGSLFLARMTNQFDGVSFVIEKNQGQGTENQNVSEAKVKQLIASAMKDFASSLMEE